MEKPILSDRREKSLQKKSTAFTYIFPNKSLASEKHVELSCCLHTATHSKQYCDAVVEKHCFRSVCFLLHAGMPLLWRFEKSNESSSPVPSKLWAIRSTERCTKSSRMWVWWPVTSLLTPQLPVWSWPPRWDSGPLSAATSTTGPLLIHCSVGVFSFRFWGACSTEGQRLWGRWHGSSLMRSITWETQVYFI